jgi:dynein heavy chain
MFMPTQRKMSERGMAALRQDKSDSESEDGETTYRSLPNGSTSDISASVIQAIPFQARNYYKSVSENKEIIKLVSVLSTSINSTKKVHTGVHTK